MSDSRSNSPIARISSLDHLVLTVKSIPATVDWYTRVLGMRHTAFSPPSSPSIVRHALAFGDQKINLHQSGQEFEPKAANVMPGSGDLCFLTKESVDEIIDRLRNANVEILEGNCVVERTGARGRLRSIYVRDPDENLIEISNMV